MRTPDVEEAMSYRNGPLSCVLTMSDGSKRYGHEILAAEVERLEKENFTLQWEPAKLRARAEAAEARVKELEAWKAEASNELVKCGQRIGGLANKVNALEAQNARLRAALEHMANMPEYDQDDAHRLRHQAKAALNGEEAST